MIRYAEIKIFWYSRHTCLATHRSLSDHTGNRSFLVFVEVVQASSRSGTECMIMHSTMILDFQIRGQTMFDLCLVDRRNIHILVEAGQAVEQPKQVRSHIKLKSSFYKVMTYNLHCCRNFIRMKWIQDQWSTMDNKQLLFLLALQIPCQRAGCRL